MTCTTSQLSPQSPVHLWPCLRETLIKKRKVNLPTGCGISCISTGKLLEVSLGKNEEQYAAKIVSNPQFRP